MIRCFLHVAYVRLPRCACDGARTSASSAGVTKNTILERSARRESYCEGEGEGEGKGKGEGEGEGGEGVRMRVRGMSYHTRADHRCANANLVW